MNNAEQKISTQEGPPIFKSWSLFYLTVSANLVLLLLMFYVFTIVFE